MFNLFRDIIENRDIKSYGKLFGRATYKNKDNIRQLNIAFRFSKLRIPEKQEILEILNNGYKRLTEIDALEYIPELAKSIKELDGL
jgi:hypothetical protein